MPEGVVFCQLFKRLTVAIDATVSHMSVYEDIVAEQKTRKRRAHAFQGFVLVRVRVDAGVGGGYPAAQRMTALFNRRESAGLRNTAAHRIDGLCCGDLSCIVSSHTIRENVKLCAGQRTKNVFIVRSDATDIRETKELYFH